MAVPKKHSASPCLIWLGLRLFWWWWIHMFPLFTLLLCLEVIVIHPGLVHGDLFAKEVFWVGLTQLQHFCCCLGLLDFLNECQQSRNPTSGDLCHIQSVVQDVENWIMTDFHFLHYRLNCDMLVFKHQGFHISCNSQFFTERWSDTSSLVIQPKSNLVTITSFKW